MYFLSRIGFLVRICFFCEELDIFHTNWVVFARKWVISARIVFFARNWVFFVRFVFFGKGWVDWKKNFKITKTKAKLKFYFVVLRILR